MREGGLLVVYHRIRVTGEPDNNIPKEVRFQRRSNVYTAVRVFRLGGRTYACGLPNHSNRTSYSVGSFRFVSNDVLVW